MQEISFKPGTIKSIKLVNFMCHNSFDIKFGPHINFVIGPNGSGKSALLTALVVALGGRATVTSRAKRLDEFIKYGKNFAKITIVLHNYEKIMDKQQAYKPDDYGKFIIIEKTLNKNSAARLSIRNDKSQLISERSSELSDMLEHFSIQINNPICILNQEVSKVFLHSKRPEDKFDLFMKATNIEQIENDYNETHGLCNEWKDTTERYKTSAVSLDREYKSCEEKVRFLERRAKLDEEINKIQRLAVWALIRDGEKEIQDLTDKIKETSSEITSAEDEIENKKSKIKKFNDEIELANDRFKSFSEVLEESRTKCHLSKERETKLRLQIADLNFKVDSSKKKIADYKQQRNDLKERIDHITQQLREKNSNHNNIQKRKLEVENLERDLPDLKGRERETRRHIDQLRYSINSLNSQKQSIMSSKNQKKSEICRLQQDIIRMKNSKFDTINSFGDCAKDILNEIESNPNSFTMKPVGPLGFHIKVKNQDVALALEACLSVGGTRAFLCDNYKDMNNLKNIFRIISSRKPNFRPPAIITRKFGAKHDINNFKARHPTFLTVLDHIEVDKSMVFNALVDKYNLESVLFIPKYSDAESLMIDSNAIPKNTYRAYTSDGSHMFPITSKAGYRSYAYDKPVHVFSKNLDAKIADFEQKLKLMEQDCAKLDVELENINNHLEIQKSEQQRDSEEVERIVTEMRQKDSLLMELKMLLAQQDEPVEMTVLEEELLNTSKAIEKENILVDKYLDEIKELTNSKVEVSANREECQQKLNLHEEKLKEISKMISDNKASINLANHAIKSLENRIKSKSERKIEQEERLKVGVTQLNASMTKAQGSRPRNIPSYSDIEVELKKLQVQQSIDCGNMQNQREMVASINERMKEIQNTKQRYLLNNESQAETEESLAIREEGFKVLRSHTFSKVGTSFSTVMKTMNMTGTLDICLDDVVDSGQVVKKARTLEIKVVTHNNPSQRIVNVMSDSNNNSTPRPATQPANLPDMHSKPKRRKIDHLNESGKENDALKMSDTRSLSGGERSFSTVAFVLALWHHCVSPFKLMDEIDVFMDMVTRRQSYNALISFANISTDPGQFIFFSPLSVPKISNPENICVFEMPVIVRRSAAAEV